MSEEKKDMDMYTAVKALLMQENETDKFSQMHSFMIRMKEMGDSGNLTFSEVRKLADTLSYEFILDLFEQDELALQIVSEKSLANFAAKIQELFLQSRTVGRRRAML